MREWWKQFPKPYKIILAMLSCAGMANVYLYFVKGISL
jgi:hypothetical protein